MALANLKMIDGNLTLTVPDEVQQKLALDERSSVDVSVGEGGIRLAHRARTIPRFNLDDLLADYEQWPQEMKDYREWVDVPRVGRELI